MYILRHLLRDLLKFMKTETSWLAVVLLLGCISLSSCQTSSNIAIINGPQNTTVCINDIAKFNCGFTGADPNHVFPRWRITSRIDNGSILTIPGGNIINAKDGRQWVPDRTSGTNNAPNSKLLVGPVNRTHNQSLYQCIFETLNHTISSCVGILTVVDAPFVDINITEVCITSINISLSTYSHLACGDVSHNVTISGIPVTSSGPIYTVHELQSNTQYNITVTSTYKSGNETYSESVNTLLPKSPNSINASSIKCNGDKDDLTITWEQPEVDDCTMLPVNYYNVTVSSKAVVITSNRTDVAKITFKHPNDPSVAVNITVVDTNEQSVTTFHEINVITLCKLNPMPVSGGSGRSNKNTDKNICMLTMILLLLLKQLL